MMYKIDRKWFNKPKTPHTAQKQKHIQECDANTTNNVKQQIDFEDGRDSNDNDKSSESIPTDDSLTPDDDDESDSFTKDISFDTYTKYIEIDSDDQVTSEMNKEMDIDSNRREEQIDINSNSNQYESDDATVDEDQDVDFYEQMDDDDNDKENKNNTNNAKAMNNANKPKVSDEDIKSMLLRKGIDIETGTNTDEVTTCSTMNDAEYESLSKQVTAPIIQEKAILLNKQRDVMRRNRKKRHTATPRPDTDAKKRRRKRSVSKTPRKIQTPSSTIKKKKTPSSDWKRKTAQQKDETYKRKNLTAREMCIKLCKCKFFKRGNDWMRLFVIYSAEVKYIFITFYMFLIVLFF